MKLTQYLKPEHIFIADTYKSTDDFYAKFSHFLKKDETINDTEKVKRLFIKRESIQSTALGGGAAAPHIYSDEFQEFLFSLAVIKEGMEYGAPDKNKVYLVFLIMSDDRYVGLHLKTLSRIAKLVLNTDLVEVAKQASSPKDLYDAFIERDKSF